MNDNYKVFDYELSLISDESIREFTKKALQLVPDYFYTVPASSTGKYHPSYSLGEGGLVRHTQSAVRIANELFRAESVFSFDKLQQSMILCALILHDSVKSGIPKQKYTVATHPLEASKLISTHPDLKDMLNVAVLNKITDCINSHMGHWNTDYRTKKKVLPVPQTGMEKFVHLCDYLASRKCLEFNFNV